MNKREAYQLGVWSGEEAGQYGDFTPKELSSEDAFMQACYEICDNKRQYADHPGEDFNREPNSESLWDAFDKGEYDGSRKAWRTRQKKGGAAATNRAPRGRRRHPRRIVYRKPQYAPNSRGWKKEPSVTTGGKPFFFYRKVSSRPSEWVVWDRRAQRWAYQIESKGKKGEAIWSVIRHFTSPDIAKRYADEFWRKGGHAATNPLRQYAVFRYQYGNMPAPRWGAVDATGPFPPGMNWRDYLPPSVLADPGILGFVASCKREAIEKGKQEFAMHGGRTRRTR